MTDPLNLDQLIASNMPEGAIRILDVGCGDGAIGVILKESGSQREVWGFENRPALAAVARQRLDRVITGDIESFPILPLPEGFFDVIVFANSLGDMRDPESVLARAIPLLAPSGRIICLTRNVAHWSVVHQLLAGSPDHRRCQLLNRRSFRYFTQASFRSMLFHSGYRIVAEERSLVPNPELQRPLEVAAEQSGADPAQASEDLSTLHALFVAEPLPPQTDSTAGSLPEASSEGTSIVVVSFNSAEVIERGLESAFSALGTHDEVIVVDNASTDGTLDLLVNIQERFPDLRVLPQERNLGFAGGCNVGIRQSNGATILLLNPDATLLPGSIERMRRRFDDPSVAAVGPVSDYVAGRQFLGEYLQSSGPTNAAAVGDALSSGYNGRSVETRMLIGFCMMIRRESLNTVGVLDESLFLGGEDIELCWRLRSHGFRLLVAIDTFVQHVGGISRRERSDEVQALLDQSSEALRHKLRAAYSPGPAPSSQDVWDSPILPASDDRGA